MKKNDNKLRIWLHNHTKQLKELGIVASIVLAFATLTVGISLIANRIHEQNIVNYDWLKQHVFFVSDATLGDSVVSVSKSSDINIYNENYRKVISEAYEEMDKSYYEFSYPLIIYNLYGTNTLGFNIYFETEEESSLEYVVTVNDDKIDEFKRTLKNTAKNNLATIHEYQLIGFVPGYINSLTLNLRDKNGDIMETQTIELDLTSIETNSQVFAEVTEGESTEELEDGLYTILGNDSDEQDYVAMYDNDGVLRSEIPIIGYRAHRILFKDNSMYFSISQSKIVKMGRTGEVEEVYETSHYHLHHDYTFSDDGNIIVLANNLEKTTEEDCIIKIDLETKEVTELIDFEPMFQSYVDTCTLDTTGTRDEGEDGLDWLHLNSIEYVDGDVFLSSRETSSILKVTDIETEPKLEYIISDEDLWKDTEFADYIYEKVGDFKIHAGQHSVRYTPTSDTKIYYLTFFDNNYGKANSQPDYDYGKIGITNNNPFNGTHSYYYVYKVNEHNKTFKLVDSIELTYSGIVSSIQDLDNGNILTDSGTAGVYAEFDEDHDLIRSFKLKMNKYMVYRVLKYDYSNYWFQD